MKPFVFTRATDADAAVQAASQPGASFLAGGTNLVDLMKEGVAAPERLVDINRLPLAAIEAQAGGGLRLGALARNSDTADHRLVRLSFPLVAQAVLAGASGQLRNAATNGGNLRQRTRCPYFYDVSQPCNKREPGTGCSALEGFNRSHAILGTSQTCIATYPGDMAQALHALDAVVQLQGPAGRRTIPITEFHRLPGDTPELDANLRPGELITAIDLPGDGMRFAQRSHYLKVRDRASYAFALVSVAAALDMDGDRIRQARLCLGSVAHMPWRAREAEALLQGARPGRQAFRQAAEAALAGATGFEHNRFKIEMARRAMVRALETASRMTA
ncbi:FAD binding domain-containing protein [Variovorax sp. MHTC-1]|uniref:FAD binding domain-containing protein n=1 Tax=Variovorax sp. MHTC-1 TaxID=2495593 RepID=UPI000F88603E|nr:xanthine dehydrogenase family protein subunit M [Variovorax sp. MHTC-1]RST48221.1 xanthine dehydrogenase family protein subunit M [Variovorax sp. MHTC-1]